ncbi:hypothetical protein FDP41_003135 [Naegleria fowleri]|uniref:Uncharacterized protein n=1 Tax=Naegleria fowleri TaxID=5763 RepID=A0A6A5BIT0_NAEFO|nr:uncharacterized protein FDP41_003135 [Naegleria fowleri]KAF0977813.1 hypothetical protein FDP41_003135 [Naegleria fowleri]CAG4712429.1 unnamed protein product [Naegleria fowleri]
MTSHHPRTTLGAYAAAYVHHHHQQQQQPSSSNNSNRNQVIELGDGRILPLNHNLTEEEIHLRLKEEKRKKEEERLRKLRIETAKRRKKQEQLDAQLKEKKDLEIEKALQERKERIQSASKLKKTPISKITTTTNTQRPYSEEGTKLPALHKNEKKEPVILAADITKKQIRHLNVLESLDLQGITSSTDLFLLAEKMANRESIRASEAYGALKVIEQNPSTDECSPPISSPHDNNVVKIVSPSNKMKRVRIQVVEDKQTMFDLQHQQENKQCHLPNIAQKSGIQHDEIEQKQVSTTSQPKKKPLVKEKKKPAMATTSTGVSIDIEKIEKDIVLIDKALLEKYQNLRKIDSSMLQRAGSNDSSYISSTSSNSASKKPKTAAKRGKPVFSNRVRKF